MREGEKRGREKMRKTVEWLHCERLKRDLKNFIYTISL
jgi:hypothetical protein